MKRTLQSVVDCAFMQNFKFKNTNRLLLCRNYRTQPEIKEKDGKPSHPYKKLHAWNSIEKFSKDLTENLIYNQDGVVVLNKPYGISNKPQEIIRRDPTWNLNIGIANSVNYTLTDALPNIANKLGYSSLVIAKSPEKHISGIAILVDRENKVRAVKTALARAQCAQQFPKTYWIVTTKLPKDNRGELNLAITKKESPCKTYKQPVILAKWGANEVKRGDVKTFDVQYRIISTSSEKLSCLMEIKCFTTKWHAIRVFATTILMSPILGDRIHGSRVQKLMGTYLHISPFVEAAREEPKLDQALLKKLNLTTAQRVIIPTHIHLREMRLPSFLPHGRDLKLVAPLPTAFQWTCDQLEFQIPTENEEIQPQLAIAATQ